MFLTATKIQRRLLEILTPTLAWLAVLTVLAPMQAQAVPSFARQTGQNCVSCHAGGQFPELTPYGRMFKMTGYTIGSRAMPLAVMGVVNYAKVADTTKSDNPATDFQKNGSAVFSSGSLFIAGKITDNIGLFSQITYDHFGSPNDDGSISGHTSADNIDLRYADRFVDANRDLIVGVSLNNNPSVSDPWNTAAAWMQYVPAASLGSHQFADANTPFPGYGSGGNIAGISAYMFWNKTVYAELGTYRTANQGLSFMSAGVPDGQLTQLSGSNNPYWRLAVTREWGPHNLMVGTSGMIAHVYDTGSDTDPDNLGLYRNTGIDAQYQYLLDPHTFTAQVAYMRQVQTYSVTAVADATAAATYVLADGVTPVDAANPTDTTNVFRAKVSYVYQAKYGGSLAFFNKTGTSNTLNQTSGFDPVGCEGTIVCSASSTRVGGSLAGNPATSGITYEAFWIPKQNIRIGAQYTAYNKFNGASDNYDGFGRNAKDNNTLFAYIWFIY